MTNITVNYACHHTTQGFDLRGVVFPERIDRLVSLIHHLVPPAPDHTRQLLDIGCGTGRFTIPLACALDGFDVAGADRALNMLQQAQAKSCSDRVNWSVQDIRSLDLPSETFDVVFVSDVLHHLDDPIDALRQCYRVLRPNGWLISKYGAMENIARDPEHRFFPGAIDVDAERTPTVQDMTLWLETCGFKRAFSNTENEQTRLCALSRLDAARAKSISVLHLIQDSQFEEGLAAMSDYVEKNPNDAWLLLDPTTFTCGQR